MLGNAKELIDYLLEFVSTDKTFKLKEVKTLRSLSQNSYSWVLTQKLADKLRISKEELHEKLLEDYGQSSIISVRSDINVGDYFDYYKKLGESQLKGKTFAHYKIYKPTHKMNTKEMAIFIDGLVAECEEQGIPTLNIDKIKEMKLI